MTASLLGGAERDFLSHDAWVFLGVLVVQFAGIAVVWLQGRATKATAEEAKELSRPTGNGFANDVMAALARIERKVDDHLSDHASADVHRGATPPDRPRRVW